MQIRLALSEDDRLAVYRFRYDVYVNEMNRPQTYADHALRLIQEPLDLTGHLLLAEEAGHVIGTARFNVGVDDTFGFYRELYRLPEFRPFYPSAVSITTKFMVARSYEQSVLPKQLCDSCYRHGLLLGTAFDFIDCNDPLVPFFRKIGYRQVFPNVQHPEYGEVVPMVLAMHDLEHLRSVRSPFVRSGLLAGDQTGSVRFFEKHSCNLL